MEITSLDSLTFSLSMLFRLVSRPQLTSRILLLFFSNKEDDTQPTVSHLLNGLEENRQEKILSENKARNSETEKEEGNYEELVCLVRQFYVERPVNPSAIAHHNIETC